MRVIYDYGFGVDKTSPVSIAGHRRSEQVLVVHAAKRAEESAGKGRSFSGDGYEVRLSDEALARDAQVRAHEQSHLAALGSAAASPVIYDLRTGPGGESVAVGGRVAVDLSEVPGDPEATLRKARAVIAAADAPREPSAADRATAERAYALASKAREDLAANVDLKA